MTLAPVQPASSQRRYTADEFEQLLQQAGNAERRLELVNGYIEEKPIPTEAHFLLAGRFIGEVYKQSPTGRVGPEVHVRMPGISQDSRLPDVAFFEDTTRPVVKQGAVSQMPDLVIEIKSPGDTYRKMRERAQCYLANGARMVCLVYPEKYIVEVYTPDSEVDILTIGDTLTGGDVLPGFALPLAQLFANL